MPKLTMGRRPKLTQVRLNKAKEVLNNETAIIARTIEDIMEEINYRLDKEQRISMGTLNDYIQGRIPDVSDPSLKAMFEEFSIMFKGLTRVQKQKVIGGIYNGDDKRQGKAWIAERKRPKKRGQKTDVNHNVSGTVKVVELPAIEVIDGRTPLNDKQ